MQREKPKSAAAVMATLTAVTSAVPKRLVIRSDRRLDTMVPAAMIMEITPAKESSAPKSRRMTGQAEPSSESGRPRLMKAR